MYFSVYPLITKTDHSVDFSLFCLFYEQNKDTVHVFNDHTSKMIQNGVSPSRKPPWDET